MFASRENRTSRAIVCATTNLYLLERLYYMSFIRIKKKIKLERFLVLGAALFKRKVEGNHII
jgi:hypothetical protein